MWNLPGAELDQRIRVEAKTQADDQFWDFISVFLGDFVCLLLLPVSFTSQAFKSRLCNTVL